MYEIATAANKRYRPLKRAIPPIVCKQKKQNAHF